MTNKDDDFGFDESEYDEFEDDFVDEFADSGESETHEGDGSEDNDGREEWDYYEDKSLENAGLGAQKEKKSIDLSFNAWAIIGAILVGLIVLVSTVMSEKAKITIDRFVSVLKMTGQTDGPVFGEHEVQTVVIDDKSKTPTENQQQGFLHEPEVLDKMVEEMKGGPPMPTPISQEEGMAPTPMPGDDESVRRAQKVNGPDENISNILPSADDVLKTPAEPAKPEGPMNIEDIAELEIEKKKQEVTQAELKERNDANEDSGSVLTPMEDMDIETLPAENQTPQEDEITPVAAINNETAEALEQRLNLITSRLDDIEKQISDLKTTATNGTSGDLDEKIANLSEQVEKIKTTTPEPQKQTTEKAQASDAPAPKKSAPAKKKSSSSAPKWELRAAQPGKAWVATKGKNDLKPVVVGDTLPGIGTVTTIVFKDGKWAIFGTAGNIRQ